MAPAHAHRRHTTHTHTHNTNLMPHMPWDVRLYTHPGIYNLAILKSIHIVHIIHTYSYLCIYVHTNALSSVEQGTSLYYDLPMGLVEISEHN